MEVLFKGPLSEATEAIKCNYVIYWSGDHGMDLVDKWTTKAKINDGNKDTLATYWKHFEEYIPTDCSSGTQVTIPRFFDFRRFSH